MEGPTGKHVRVRAAYTKGDYYREPPVPETAEAIANTLAYGQANDEPLFDVDGTTVYRWVRKAADELQEETGDDGTTSTYTTSDGRGEPRSWNRGSCRRS